MKSLIMTPANAEAAHCGNKTKTRRPFKVQPFEGCTTCKFIHPDPDGLVIGWDEDKHGKETYGVFNHTPGFELKCPFVPDEIVYIREVWAAIHSSCHIDYKAHPGVDGQKHCKEQQEWFDLDYLKSTNPNRYRSSLHMPEWAARTKVRITNIKAERVGDISEEDAIAEGIERTNADITFYRYPGQSDTAIYKTAGDAFEAEWISIYGQDSWDCNDWVWVYEFERVEV